MRPDCDGARVFGLLQCVSRAARECSEQYFRAFVRRSCLYESRCHVPPFAFCFACSAAANSSARAGSTEPVKYAVYYPMIVRYIRQRVLSRSSRQLNERRRSAGEASQSYQHALTPTHVTHDTRHAHQNAKQQTEQRPTAPRPRVQCRTYRLSHGTARAHVRVRRGCVAATLRQRRRRVGPIQTNTTTRRRRQRRRQRRQRRRGGGQTAWAHTASAADCSQTTLGEVTVRRWPPEREAAHRRTKRDTRLCVKRGS